MNDETRLAQARALKEWRVNRGDTQKSLAASLGASQASVATWENGKTPIGRVYLPKLKSLGFVMPEETAADAELDPIAEEIGALLASGAPLAEVYQRALQAQASFLKGDGLSPGRKAAWDLLLKTIKDTIAERHGHEPIEKHPQWPELASWLTETLANVPGALEAIAERISHV